MDERKEIEDRIRLMQHLAGELSEKATTLPALAMNVLRIQASLKMLELNLVDAWEP